MSFEDAMNTTLPPIDGVGPHITGHYGENRKKGPHGGTDINYRGGQDGINATHQPGFR